MRVPSSVLEDINIQTVVRDELLAQNRFLPPDLVNYALISNADRISDWLSTRLRRDIEPATQDTVLAKKAPRGSRPLPFMTLEDRLLYRAVVRPLRETLPNSRVNLSYDDFLNAPLEVQDCEYVLKADIAAYYQYIDHERLIDEVIAQTGDDLAVSTAVTFLQASSGRRFGLPQMSQPSDILADCYIDPIRRDLLRHEFTAFRYVDDFRIACVDYEDALEALELLERSAFSLGLVLNDAKTLTPHIDTYRESLGAVKRAEAELFSQLESTVDGFFLMGGGYEDTEAGPPELLPWIPGVEDDEVDLARGIEEPPTEVQVAAAQLLLELWERDEEDQDLDWATGTWAVLLRKAFAILALDTAGNAENHSMTVPLATSLLVYQPHLTYDLVNYLVPLGQNDTELVSKILDEVSSKHVLSPWQLLWLTHLAGTLPLPATRSPRHVKWLQRETDTGKHDAVAARAALALAQRQHLTVRQAHATYERIGPAHRRTVALARAAAEGERGRSSTHDDLVDDIAAAWVHSQRWGRPRGRRANPRTRAE